jgi:hypothetical protein
MTEDLSYLKTQNSLRKTEKKNKIRKIVVNRVKQIDNYQSLKDEQEILLFCCNSIENLVKTKYGIDKKELVVEIMTNLFNLNVQEQETLRQTIQFLFDNLLIKLVPKTEKLKYFVISWIKRKFL